MSLTGVGIVADFGAFAELDRVTSIAAALAAASGLAACAALDHRRHRLPAQLVTATGVVPLAFLAVAASLHHPAAGSLGRALLAGAIVWAGFLTLRLVSGRGVSYGDVRLAAAAAIVPGWLSWTAVGVMVVTSFIAAAALLLLTGPSQRADSRQPFAPSLALAWITALALSPA